MDPGWTLLLLTTALVTCGHSVLVTSGHSVLDPDSVLAIQAEAEGEFGAAVAGVGPDDHQGEVLVGAPREGDDVNGSVYRCHFPTRECQKIPLNGVPGAVNASLGLAVAAAGGGALVCGPTSPQRCGVNVHLNGHCVQLDTALRPLRRLPGVIPECPQSSLDIAFLVDGSGSIADRDFRTMKTFVAEVMRRFRGSDTQFSLTQFSDQLVVHFDFEAFRRFPRPDALLANVRQLRGTTHTATAIKAVVDRMFGRGRSSRAGARRVLVVVTDGEKFGDELEYSDVIPAAEELMVTRYAIGVGGAFQTPSAEAELSAIASAPPADHVFRVDNFDALEDIQGHLRDKIFAIEGTNPAHSSSFQLEMAQEGFSALMAPSGPVLGAVGAFSWAGGAFVYGEAPATPATFVNASGDGDGDMRDAYLGYSSAALTIGPSPALALGAPRFRHLGRVLVLLRPPDGHSRSPGGHSRSPGGNWKVLAEVTGTQVGSYFGASLLAVEPRPLGEPRPPVPRPSAKPHPQVLLVGSPHFYGGGGGGRVDVWAVSEEAPHLRLLRTLQPEPGHALGQFGAALALLGHSWTQPDTAAATRGHSEPAGHSDGHLAWWPVVAVGAPLEDGGRGAVYLFRGGRGGVGAGPTQRIAGSALPSRPRLFGRALSGGRDLSGDGLDDLAVGAKGQVLLLRSPPLLTVSLSVSFRPRLLPAPECPEAPDGVDIAGGHSAPATPATPDTLDGPEVTAKLCATGVKATRDNYGSEVFLLLWFHAELDPGRVRGRGVFGVSGAPKSQNGTLRVGEGPSCQNLRIRVQRCPQDSLTPLTLRVTLGGSGEPLQGGEGLRPQLGPGSDTALTAALPFDRGCGADGICRDDLRVALNFSGLEELVVGEGDALPVTVTVTNVGESSFGPAVLLSHHPSLSFRKVEGRWRSGSPQCHSEPPQGQSRRTRCQLRYPIMRAGTTVSFRVTLDVPADAELGDSVAVVAEAISDNGGPGGRSQRAELPVRYRVLVVLASVPDSTRSIPVPEEAPPPPAPLTHRYQVQVLGQRGLPANVTFSVPSQVGEGQQLWDHLGVTPEQEGPRCREEPETPKDPPGTPQQRFRLECPGTPCRHFRCSIPATPPPKIWDFRVGGQLRLDWMGQPKLLLLSSARIEFDRRRFQNSGGGEELQVQTELERVERPWPLPIILGASLGGLLLLGAAALALHKVGFFKRRYREMLEGAEPNGDPPGDPPGNPSETPQG